MEEKKFTATAMVRPTKNETYVFHLKRRVFDVNFKLNLESFLVLWFWISLLRLAALKVQTFIQFIFFCSLKIHHKKLGQKIEFLLHLKMS